MSTNDVPGARAENADSLGSGSWAEHDDGSLIYVAGTENGRVIFEIFDLSDEDKPVEYRDAMPLKLFQQKFSWDPRNKASVKWTWHDKTPFPWDRILKNFKEGVKPVSATQFIEDAMDVHRSRERISGDHFPDEEAHVERLRGRAARQTAKARTSTSARSVPGKTISYRPLLQAWRSTSEKDFSRRELDKHLGRLRAHIWRFAIPTGSAGTTTSDIERPDPGRLQPSSAGLPSRAGL